MVCWHPAADFLWFKSLYIGQLVAANHPMISKLTKRQQHPPAERRQASVTINERQISASNPRSKLCCRWLMTDVGVPRCWVSALIHGNMFCLTVCHPLARAPLSWAHAAPAAPAAPYKPFIPGGKTARSHVKFWRHENLRNVVNPDLIPHTRFCSCKYPLEHHMCINFI